MDCRSTTHRGGRSKPIGKDHLPNRAVRHREGSRDNPHSSCPDASAITLAGSPSCAEYQSAQVSGVRDSGQKSRIAKFTVDIDGKSTTIRLWINWIQHLRLYLIQPGGR